MSAKGNTIHLSDPDLIFLSNADNKDLDILVNYLCHDKDGSKRWAEELTQSDEYKRNKGNHKAYWKLIAAELQCFGGNTVANLLRGHGVLYKEILIDVCENVKVNFNKNSSTEIIERNLLSKLLMDSMDKMSDKELKTVIEDLNIKTADFSKKGLVAAVQMAIKSQGFAAHKMAVIVANAVAKQILGKGLTFAANASLTRAIGVFAGPIGMGLMALWTIADIAGPAYRVTIPAVIQIAYMREKVRYNR